MLASLSLLRLRSTFEEEEMTLSVLRYMAEDTDDFHGSMRELGVSNADARLLHAALLKPSEAALHARPTTNPDPESEARIAVEEVLQPPAAAAAAAEPIVPRSEELPAEAVPPPRTARAACTSSGPPPPEPSLLGERVRVCGRGVGDAFGECGEVLSWDGRSGMYTVDVTIDGVVETLQLRPANLRMLVDEVVSQAAPAVPSLIGRRVRVHGLSSAPEYNGTRGRVESWDDESERYTLRIDGEKQTINVRPSHISPLSEEEEAAEAEARRLADAMPSAEVDDDYVDLERSPPPRSPAQSPSASTSASASGSASASATVTATSSASASTSVPSTADAHAAAAAAISAAAQPARMVSKLTPNGYRLVPEDNLASVMAALAAAGVASSSRAAASAAAAGAAKTASSTARAAGPSGTSVAGGGGGGGGGDGGAASSVLASALASVAALDAKALRADAEEMALEPDKPKVRSFTQINHVTPDGEGGFARQSSVDRGTSNKALEAYKRRHVADSHRGVVNFELDKGIMSDPEYKKVLERDEERIQKIYAEGGTNPYLGENFNAI